LNKEYDEKDSAFRIMTRFFCGDSLLFKFNQQK